MTSPLYETPANAYTSSTVSSMANVTQADIGQQQGAEVSAMLDNVGFSFIDIILGGFDNVFGAIGEAINKFIGDLLIGLRNVTGGLIDLTGFLKQTDTKATEAKQESAVALDKATIADVAAGNAAIVAANADSKAIQANNAAAAAAELAAQAQGGQDASNMAYVYNSEKEAMRTQFPPTAGYAYLENSSLAVSGTWYIRLQPTAAAYPLMQVGPEFTVTPGEKLYMEWRQRRNNATFNARLNLEVRDSGGNVVLFDLSPVQPSVGVANGQWATYAGIVTVPAGGVRARPQLKGQYAESTTPAPSGEWYFEELTVRRAITAAQVATADGAALDTKLVTLTENNNVTNQLAQQAANAAQNAVEVADIAYENAQYWKDECVVASAGVVRGVNELVIGVVMDVPTGRSRKITDMHFALFNKPGIISISTKVQGVPDANGIMAERTVHSFSMIAGSTRANINNLTIDVADKERVFWDVTDTGSGGGIASVLQVALVGVLL